MGLFSIHDHLQPGDSLRGAPVEWLHPLDIHATTWQLSKKNSLLAEICADAEKEAIKVVNLETWQWCGVELIETVKARLWCLRSIDSRSCILNPTLPTCLELREIARPLFRNRPFLSCRALRPQAEANIIGENVTSEIFCSVFVAEL